MITLTFTISIQVVVSSNLYSDPMDHFTALGVCVLPMPLGLALKALFQPASRRDQKAFGVQVNFYSPSRIPMEDGERAIFHASTNPTLMMEPDFMAQVKKKCRLILSSSLIADRLPPILLTFLHAITNTLSLSIGNSGVVQTAWAILGLVEADCEDKAAIDRGVAFLMERQLPSGDWPQEGITGVFNRSCGITYTAYRNVFPIWALGRYNNKYGK